MTNDNKACAQRGAPAGGKGGVGGTSIFAQLVLLLHLDPEAGAGRREVDLAIRGK